ncbi:hypothetical protein AB6A40_001763 [Gnathostoma spinigerum]|uniref:Paired domain-containing protein n=1 Tax=Gnathostoma spinigerum TaxID=75299 RepID=A0ABD6EA82_9BILA
MIVTIEGSSLMALSPMLHVSGNFHASDDCGTFDNDGAARTASSDEHINCGCIIDISTKESTEKGFNAWLKGLSAATDYGYECETSLSMNGDLPSLCTQPINCIRSQQRSQKKRESRCNKGTGTNLYGRPYCPGRPLSMTDREQIIDLHMSGVKVNAISKQLCISHGCVSKIISRYRETGVLSPAMSPDQRRSRRTKITSSTNSSPRQRASPLSTSPSPIVVQSSNTDTPNVEGRIMEANVDR